MSTAISKKHLDRVNRLLRNFYVGWVQHSEAYRKLSGSVFISPVKTTETKDAYMFFIYQPGLKSGSLASNVTGSLLTLTGDADRTATHREGGYANRFFKCLNLPGDIDRKQVNVSYKDGIVKVVVVKKAVSEKAENRSAGY